MKKWIIIALAATVGAIVQAEENSNYDSTAFKAMDTSRDQKVTRSEFIIYHREKARKAGKPFDSRKAEAEFKKKDANKNGSLTQDELLAVKPDAKKKKKAASDNEKSDEE